MKKLTLGLCILSSATALAHDLEYRVCKGDTLASIAKKFHVRGTAILHANDLVPDHKMRPGHQLLIPGVQDRHAKATVGHAMSQSLYVVRNGDMDWTLAMRNHTTLHKLHLANPGVDWDHLKIGLRLHIPGSSTAIAKAAVHGDKRTRVAINTKPTKSGGVHMHAHWHHVEAGENDWLIAHKAGIKVGLLKALNPEISITNLHVGEKVRVPGSAVAKLALHVPRIHSTHVAVKGDNVTIRTAAGHLAESICTVDAGTRAAVLDRDGNWYQLKFPKGTVGWVRGDLLKPVHEVEVVAVAHHHHHVAEHTHPTYVAESHPQSHKSAPHHAYVAAAHHSPAPKHHDYVAASHHHKVVEHSSSTQLTALDTDSDGAETVLRAAQKMRGVRYSWGNASRGATDCSGLMIQTFAKAGVHLPRVSRDQARVGTPVKYGDLKPGDLVFFHTGRGSRITHVAVYEGNGKIIHASSGKGHVTESSITEGYYRNRYSTARRVLRSHHHKVVKVAEETPKASSGDSEQKAVESEKRPESDDSASAK